VWTPCMKHVARRAGQGPTSWLHTAGSVSLALPPTARAFAQEFHAATGACLRVRPWLHAAEALLALPGHRLAWAARALPLG